MRSCRANGRIPDRFAGRSRVVPGPVVSAGACSLGPGSLGDIPAGVSRSTRSWCGPGAAGRTGSIGRECTAAPADDEAVADGAERVWPGAPAPGTASPTAQRALCAGFCAVLPPRGLNRRQRTRGRLCQPPGGRSVRDTAHSARWPGARPMPPQCPGADAAHSARWPGAPADAAHSARWPGAPADAARAPAAAPGMRYTPRPRVVSSVG